MHHVVVISDPAAPAVSIALAEKVRAALGGAAPVWLQDQVACDIALPAPVTDSKSLGERLRAEFHGAPVDFAVVEAETRRKQLLIADMDSTIIGQECIDELADMVGLKEHVAAITERAMRGEIAFEPALSERVALLKGITTDTIETLIAERITINPGARVLVQTMRKAGAYTALVSGGFTLFTNDIAARVGFDENRANHLEMNGDTVSGTVRKPILGREAKREALFDLTQSLDAGANAAIAVGDGANDLAMLDAAGLGVAYHAKPTVAEAADIRIDHGDLTALLFIQGYSASEFAT